MRGEGWTEAPIAEVVAEVKKAHSRRVLADARFVASKLGMTDADEIEVVRNQLRRAYERGICHGLEREREDSATVHPRNILLVNAASTLDLVRQQVGLIPHSDHQVHALEECVAILEDVLIGSTLGQSQ